MRTPTNVMTTFVFRRRKEKRKEKRHNESFWRIINKKFKNYVEMEKKLVCLLVSNTTKGIVMFYEKGIKY